MAGDRLTLDEFEAMRPLLGRMSTATIEVARVVIVDGMTQAEAAIHYGMTRQRVYGIMQRFRAMKGGLPTRWRKIEVWLPPELAAQVEAMSEAALIKLRDTRKLETKQS